MINQDTATLVKVVDGVMVMSLMNARKPVVWRIDVEKINAASLEIDGSDEAGYTLKLAEASGKAQEIAIFDEMEDAKAVLVAATQELLSVSQVVAVPAAHMVHAQSGTGAAKSMHAFFAAFTALIVIVILAVAFSSVPETSGVSEGASITSAPTASSGGAGQAVSADDFLNNR